MSSRLPAAIMLALCLGILCLAAPSRASTVWLYGGTNNASVYGVTADTALSIGWKDTQLTQAQPSVIWGTNATLQANLNNAAGFTRSAILFGFDGTGIPSTATILSATLFLTVNNFAGSVDTWQIRGVAAADAGWMEGEASFDKPFLSAASWSGGGAFDSSLGTVFGSFTESNPASGSLFSLDVTSALQAIVNGTSAGLALLNYSNVSAGPGSAQRISFHSDESATPAYRPGLLVEFTTTAVPEPSRTLLFLGAAFMSALRRRRGTPH